MTVQTLDLIRLFSASEICKAKYVTSFTIALITCVLTWLICEGT